MNVNRVKIERTFNLGNYETLRIGLEGDMKQGENPFDCLKMLEDLAENYFAVRMGRTEKQQEKPQPQGKPPTDLLINFPTEVRGLLEVSEMPKIWYIKPVSFLGTENFAVISNAVRALGGKYVSEGKTSHFEIPKETK